MNFRILRYASRQFIRLLEAPHPIAYSMRMKINTLLAVLFALQQSVAWSFADEERDWGVPPTRDIRQAPYSAPTPTEIAGARLIFTGQLHNMLVMMPAPVLIDVAGGDEHVTLRGAFWIPGMGRGNHFLDPIQAQTVELLEKLTNGDKSRPLVFFCVNAQCWLSYNASLRAVAAGYQQVFWYRGGIQAWAEADLPLAKVSLSTIATPDARSDSK
ncbi:MAG: rhodanese-like domain-containing protein [Burkholderiales bacterium]